MTTDEKQKFLEEIIKEVDRTKLKKEILDELCIKNKKLPLFLKHPLVLIFISFLFTTIIGSVLTSHYKKKEFNNQQKIVFQERLINKKIDLTNTISEAISESIMAANDFVRVFKYDNRKYIDKSSEIESVRKYWLISSKNWRISKYNLRAQLSIYFNDPEIDTVFDDIINVRKSKIGIPILNIWDIDMQNIDSITNNYIIEKCDEIHIGYTELLQHYEILERMLNYQINDEMITKLSD